MRISNLIEALEGIKDKNGDLVVAVFCNESTSDYSFYDEGSYYITIDLEVIKTNERGIELKKNYNEHFSLDEPYFLGIR